MVWLGGITDAFTFGGIIFCCFLVPPGSLYVATKIKPIKINLTEYATIIVGRYLQFLPLETDPTNRSNAVLAAISQGRSSLNIN
jgi:hypothetical protein